MNDLYAQYVGQLVTIDLDRSVIKENPYVARVKAIDASSVLLGHHEQYDPMRCDSLESAVRGVLKVEKEGVAWGARMGYRVGAEVLLSRNAVARVTACKVPTTL